MKHIAIAALSFMALAAQIATGADFYMTINGTQQGSFKGERLQAGQSKETLIPCIGFSYDVKSPRDQATGQASGRRTHSAVRITKEWGASIPLHFQALTTNEVLKDVEFTFYKANANGQQTLYYRIKLTNATVSQIRLFTEFGLENVGAKHSSASAIQLEEISFTFQKIEIANLAGGTSAGDDWGGRGVLRPAAIKPPPK